jgi:hypothetical protein
VPALEALLPRFRSARTQPLGISVDSVYCHANWAKDLGGVSFPLLSDFHPKGAVATSMGAYLADKGITDRATVVIDAAGVVRHASSVTPAGKRNMEELAALCARIDAEHGQGLPTFAAPPGLEAGAKLFVKSACGFSRAVLLARDNLHLGAALPATNVSENAAARGELVSRAGKDQAPALLVGERVIQESKDIIAHLAERQAPL